MDQTELANATGLSRQSISAYERNLSIPRRPALLAIALATGFDFRWLETGEESESPGYPFQGYPQPAGKPFALVLAA